MNTEQTIQIANEFYNVGEEYTLYDTIAIVSDLATRATQPPGWYATFAAFQGATNHSFFNVRNVGNCEKAYCNLQARDQMSFAFQADSIGAAFWGGTYGYYDPTGFLSARFYEPLPIWQCVVPMETSLTLRVQQDDKLKLNAMMAGAGYGPTGGGYGNMGDNMLLAGSLSGNYPQFLAQTQGVPDRRACMPLPNKINIPRRGSISISLSLTEYVKNLLAVILGPGQVRYQNPTHEAYVSKPVMFGITVTLNGKRLVQQRGALHA